MSKFFGPEPIRTNTRNQAKNPFNELRSGLCEYRGKLRRCKKQWGDFCHDLSYPCHDMAKMELARVCGQLDMIDHIIDVIHFSKDEHEMYYVPVESAN